MILRTQTPSHTDSFGQQRQKFYLVVGQAIRQRRTGYAGGAQVTPEAHKSNNGEQEGRAIKKGIKTPPQAGDILIANFKIM